MRRLIALTACIVLGFLAACGDDAPTDEQQVRDALTTFASSVEGRDYQTLCGEVFAPELLTGLQQIGLPCEVAMRKSFEDDKDPRLTVGEVTVDGTTAQAEIRTSAQGKPPSADILVLTKVDGRWQVSALGADPEPKATPSP